ncbi:helix-turn-helix transcriptional regulator [Anaerococcus sp. Marseille-P3915]|uniref:helix-turn-helix transcriptional regulator n=1 Tax=Anaerococcus sp. Marseille-P3915 TaxID=2057799 RepID=UPI000D0B141E|nr:helix-turn-helix transcriptional regulator [Anaerococcus sp. Marseille-P3915]
MDLVNNLADFRKKAGYNQAELGGLVGVSRQTISLIERGDYNPSVTVALKIAQVLDVDINEIFRLEDSDEKE